MDRVIVVRGILSDPSHIELEQPVSDFHGQVEVIVRPIGELAAGSPLAVLDAKRALPDVDADEVDELERMIDATAPSNQGGHDVPSPPSPDREPFPL
jgi:hypothetical protein